MKQSMIPSRLAMGPGLSWGVVGAVLGLILLFGLSLQDIEPIEGLIIYPRPERGHRELVIIPAGELPPAGGVHNSTWQNCGIYLEPIRPENGVHSLEHGAVWLTYRPDISPTDLQSLQELVRGRPFLLLSPYPGQKALLVLTAWGVQLPLDNVQDERIAHFIERYRLGPTTPEQGSSCSGSVGLPEP